MRPFFADFSARVFERAFYPLLVAMQTVPKVALAPLLVLYLGYDFAPKCFLAFLLAYFPIVIATVVELQGLDKAIVDLVRRRFADYVGHVAEDPHVALVNDEGRTWRAR